MFGIGGDVGIVVVVRMVTTVLRVAVIIRKDLFICILGGGICGVGKIENWLGPQHNWLQSAFSKMPLKKAALSHIFTYLFKLYLFLCTFNCILGL